jgi:hypothetical protein
LCEAHKLQTEEEMQEEGLGDFLESAGFRAEFELRPIKEEETCDYIDHAAAGWELCGGKSELRKIHSRYLFVLRNACRGGRRQY